MGQYYLTCNLDKHEFIHPHKFGDGLKLLEFGSSADGTMTGLAVLLACSNGRGGGGDLHDADDTGVPGRWSGDRISVIGDYAEDGDPGIDASDTPFTVEGRWTDISGLVLTALRRDCYLRENLP